MKIKMLTTVPGSLDGIHVKTYEAGIEYELGDSPGAHDLAQALINARMAAPPDPVNHAPIEPAPAGFFMPVIEEKAAEPAPENKTFKRPYNRKAK